MSIQNLITPLPKIWAKISCDTINVNNLQVDNLDVDTLNSNIVNSNIVNTNILDVNTISAPFLVEGNIANNDYFIKIVQDNNSAGINNVALEIANNSGSSKMRLVTSNDPSPSSSVLINGTYNVSSLEPGSDIIISPNQTPSLTCSYVSPGVTQTFIQNLTFPTLGGVPTNLNYYEEWSSDYSFFGPWGATSYIRTVSAVRIGKLVALNINAISQTASVEDSITMDGSLPTRFIPKVSADLLSTNFMIPVLTDNSIMSGILRISNTGVVTISFLNADGPFPLSYGPSSSTNNVGFDNININYLVS